MTPEQHLTFHRLGLTAQEAVIANELMRAKGRVLSRAFLDDQAPHIRSADRDERCIDGIISKIRRKMGPGSIETIRSLGWRMTKAGQDAYAEAEKMEMAA